MPVYELRERITYSEFTDWVLFLEWEHARHSKEDYYLAQIAAEVRRTMMPSSPGKIRTTDMLLEFTTSEERVSIEEQMARSKGAWAGLLGVNIGNN